MGKNKRRQIDITDERNGQIISCDSNEEVDFYYWCIEAEKLGVIKEFKYQPIQWVLSERKEYVSTTDKKQKNKFLCAEHIYSPDFYIVINKDYQEIFSSYFKLLNTQITKDNNPFIYIDVKGTFQRFGGDRAFSVNVKWTLDKYGVYVQKVIPKECFQKLGVPQNCIMTHKTNKVSKKYVGMKTIPTSFKLS